MKSVAFTAWTLVIAGVLHLFFGLISFGTSLLLLFKSIRFSFRFEDGFPVRQDDLFLAWSIFGQFFSVCVFALTAIALALILAHIPDRPLLKLQHWSHRRIVGHRSIAMIVAGSLGVSAVLLMIVRMSDLVAMVHQADAAVYDIVFGIIAAIAWTLVIGFSAVAIAMMLAKAHRTSTQPRSPSAQSVA